MGEVKKTKNILWHDITPQLTIDHLLGIAIVFGIRFASGEIEDKKLSEGRKIIKEEIERRIAESASNCDCYLDD